MPLSDDPREWTGSGGCGGEIQGYPTHGHPVTPEPVDLYFLKKLESVDDLRIALPGNDFIFRRQYSSDGGVSWRRHLGAQWFWNNQPQLEFRTAGENQFSYILLMMDARVVSRWRSATPAEISATFFIDAPGGGPSNQRIIRSYITRYEPSLSATATYSTFALITPGEGIKHFFKPEYFGLEGAGEVDEIFLPPQPDPNTPIVFTDPGVNALGHLAREVDVHGNIREYDYSRTDDGFLSARVSRIRFINADGTLAAVVEFDWHYDDEDPEVIIGDSCAMPPPLHGRLRRVRVLRPDSLCGNQHGVGCDLVEVERVEYTYFDDLFPPDLSSGVCWSMPADSNWLGSSGDLIQVAKYSRVDSYGPGGQAEGEPDTPLDYPWHQEIPYPHHAEYTQYRYYASYNDENTNYRECNDCPGGNQRPNTTDTYGGGDHMLRMVIHPQQVEFFAETANQIFSRETIFDRAIELMHTEHDFGLSNPPHTTAPLERVNQLAAKMVVYRDASIPGSGVFRQFLSSEGCGCGSGANLLSRKLTYFITPETDDRLGAWSTAQALGEETAPPAGEGRYVTSIKIVEDIVQDNFQFGFYREHHYDLGAWQDVTHNNPTLNPAGYKKAVTPYLINYVVADHIVDHQARLHAAPGEFVGRLWVTHFVYDDDTRLLRRIVTPAASKRDAGYQEAYFGGFLNPFGVERLPNWLPASPTSPGGDGLVHMFLYNDNKLLTERRVASGFGESPDGPRTRDDFLLGPADGSGKLIESRTYVSNGAQAFAFYLPERIERFRDASDITDEAKIETIDFDYFWSNNTPARTDLQWMKVTVEAESLAENGQSSSPAPHVTFTLFDRNGSAVYTKHPDDSIDAVFPHHHTGRPLLVERNTTVDPFAYDLGYDPTLISGWGTTSRNSDGQRLGRATVYNLRGELILAKEADGLETLYTREVRGETGASSRISRLAVIELPQLVDDTVSPAIYSGPASVRTLTAGAKPIQTEQFAIGSNGVVKVTSSSPGWFNLVSSYDLEDSRPLSRTRWNYSPAGVLRSEESWHDVSGNDVLDHKLVTHYQHDSLGRVKKISEPNGTLRGFVYDARDRVVAEYRGVSDHTTTPTDIDPDIPFVPLGEMRLVEERFYDGDRGSTPDLYWHSGGNGTLTMVVHHESTSTQRVTRHFYDWRNRLVATLRPENPVQFIGYDNLSRRTSSALIALLDEDDFETREATVEGLVSSGDWMDSTRDDRKLYERIHFSQRGLPFRREVAVNPADLGDGHLQWDFWRDERGRVVADAAPNAPMTKTRYDGLGRATHTYRTDGAGGPTPGGGFSIADYRANSAEAAVAGDRVLEQVHVEHQTSNTPGASLAGTVKSVQLVWRAHDADDALTGSLTAVSADPEASVSAWTGYAYDAAARPVRTIEFGTNNLSADVFATGSSAPNPASPDTDALITVTAYDERGLIKTIEDPEGKKTRMFYDDLSRQVAVVENWVDAVVSRDTTDPWKWTLDLGTQTGLDQDRATLSYHDIANNKSYLVAAHTAGDVSTPASTSVTEQVTVYTYRVRTGDDALGGVSSLLNSNDLLAEVKYPDSSGAGDVVSYRYNALGELTALRDQNGTVHAYDRDALGRVTSDRVAALGSDINGAIRRIELEYDSAGRRSAVRSFDAPTGGDVRNAVGFKYSPLWQISEVRQNPLGDLGGDHELVTEYTYATDAGDNYSRLDKLKYPSVPPDEMKRTALAMDYGGLDGLNDAIHRVRGFSWDFGTTTRSLTQEYVGLSLIVRKDLNLVSGSAVSPLIRHDRFINPATGVGSSGSYAALDRFGRVKGQLWVWPDATSMEWDPDDRPAIVDLRYTYDMSSNVLDRLDRRAGGRVGITGPDERYSYDGLDRLAKAERGKRDVSTGTWGSPAPRGQQWALDPVGNWLQTITDTSGDGNFVANTDFTDRRNHNLVNEISGGAYDQQVQSGTLSATDLDYTYDDAGNMTGRQKLVGSSASGWTYVYDAWNRLVTVKDGGSSSGSGGGNVRAHYAYNGLHQRAARIATSDPTLGYVDEANLYYYDAGWRLLEEHIDGEAFTSLTQPSESDPFAGIAPDTAPIFVADVMVQRVWGLEYIDELLFVMEDRDDEPEPPASASGFPDGDFTSPNKGVNHVRGYHAVVDRLYSVVALLDEQAAVLERVRYSAYGQARQQWVFIGDVNGDGRFDSADGALFLAAYDTEIDVDGNYNADADINGDGKVQVEDLLFANGTVAAAPDGQISQYANTVGYAGYLFDPATEMCLARFRWYDPEQGRWVSRDPRQYSDGQSLYQYVKSNAVIYTDPTGLASHSLPTLKKFHRLQDALLATMYASCNASGGCGGCSVEQCKKEAAKIVQRYRDVIDDLHRRPPGHTVCSTMKQDVKHSLNRGGPYNCWKVGGITRRGHTTAAVANKCGNKTTPDFELDPWHWRSNNTTTSSPRWKKFNPREAYDRDLHESPLQPPVFPPYSPGPVTPGDILPPPGPIIGPD